MKRSALALIFSVGALGVCAPAQAKPQTGVHNTVPQGNAGVNQYIESVPTAHGNRPTNSVHSRGSVHSGGGGGGTGGGGSGGAGGGTGGSSGSNHAGSSSGSISQATQKALSSRGSDGRAAVAVALAMAPTVPRHHRDVAAAGGSGSANAAGRGNSALGSVVDALTGSATNGGLGAGLPAILIVTLFGAAGMAILRYRRQH
ncbi:MAG TPA: hypothetical protein VGL51_11240 [Solirubrobacteraceae bacterium]|jgi:hypothetical protein